MNQKVSLSEVASPVRVPKTAELVASHLRRQIIRGELQEGDALPPESALMEQFGVSRPTLREAFRVLESEALISVRRGARGGARVHTPDGDVAARYAGLVLQFRRTTLADVYAGRRAIELAALSTLASKKPSAKVLEPLERNLEEMEAHADDPAKLILVQEEFHRLLVDAAGNQTLSIFEEMIHHIIELHGEAYVAQTRHEPGAGRAAKAGRLTHYRLLELLRAGKGNDALDLWRRHLDEASDLVLRGAGAKTVLDLLG
jgi:GntR family transcriptional regulator, transcriptional repressor for pyruvate dehydrogenase complex